MRLKFLIFSILLVVLLVLDIVLGSLMIGVDDFMNPDSVARTIVMDFRIPKALVAVMAGVALSVSGLLMQTIFRNPLAGPYTLGVSSGASLGVAFFLLGTPLLGISMVREIGLVASAWIGAAAVLFVIMAVSSRIKDIMAVLILGMMLSSAMAAFVDVLQYFSSDSALKGFVLWSMGSLTGLSHSQMWILTLCVFVGVLMSLAAVKSLNLLLLGENYARTMGVNVTRTRAIVFACTSILAGGVTAFCGPIAFLGTAVPHIARMVFKSADHRILLPASIILGADLMLLCDIISGLPGMDITLPINTITAMFGIPVVVMVVINSRK